MPDLIAFCGKMSGFVDEEGAVDIIYLDFSKAFLTVFYSILVILVRMLWSKWMGKNLVAWSGLEGND